MGWGWGVYWRGGGRRGRRDMDWRACVIVRVRVCMRGARMAGATRARPCSCPCACARTHPALTSPGRPAHPPPRSAAHMLARSHLHVHVVLAVPLAPLVLVHGQRVVDGVGHVSDVPGVDKQCARAQALRRRGVGWWVGGLGGRGNGQRPQQLTQLTHHTHRAARRAPPLPPPIPPPRPPSPPAPPATARAPPTPCMHQGRAPPTPYMRTARTCGTPAATTRPRPRRTPQHPTCAAPANSESTSTPALSIWQATYS